MLKKQREIHNIKILTPETNTVTIQVPSIKLFARGQVDQLKE